MRTSTLRPDLAEKFADALVHLASHHPAHKQDLAKARSDVQSHADELETLRDQLAASQAALEETRSAPTPSTDNSELDALKRQLADVKEDLEVSSPHFISHTLACTAHGLTLRFSTQSTRESAEMTKHALYDELNHVKDAHQKELDQVSQGRVEQVEAAKREHEQELEKLLREKKDLLEQVEEEREAKDRGQYSVTDTFTVKY